MKPIAIFTDTLIDFEAGSFHIIQIAMIVLFPTPVQE